ncbi:MAG: nucleolar 12 [Lasallia pustulata]|uniref:Nucleolar protein 12 n=1 Tax=Lasallia pustulata TaxID=136370 RepID=A0A5M8PLH3_9LECA|nr:MAG: nucleolar 12 [Lasallia pustulata]
MARAKAPTTKPSSEVKATFSAASKAVNPALAALFASSLGPVKAKFVPPQEAVPEESVVSSADEDDEGEGENSASDSERDHEEDATSNSNVHPSRIQFIAQALEGPKTSVRKRKRGDVADDLEGAYMQRLACEEARDEKKRRLDQVTDARAPIVGTGEGAQNVDTDEVESEAGTNDIITDVKDNIPFTQHESLAPSQKEVELQKASRTVFLANVSTSAIKSKTARKTLLDYLGSFIPSLTTHTPPHKVESLRFRSTAFASSAVPKKAAYARKELMDATTKSTNAYAVYTTPLAAREAVKRLNGTMVLERHLRVDGVAHPAKTDHRRCVFVGNLGFVDDESSINAAADEESGKKPRKVKEPADIEEGLWRQFSRAGAVESVRVVRDKMTRVGKGFAYVQFQDANAVETALLYNEKKYPPMLPRILRVTRAKDPKKTALYSNSGKGSNKDVPTAKEHRGFVPKVSSKTQSLVGRAGKLLGRAGAAQFNSADQYRGSNKRINGIDKTPEDIVFEGYRASNKQGKGTLKLGGSGKKQGKPRTRSSKRGAAFKATGGKKGK